MSASVRPLFLRYPGTSALAHVPIGVLPTPVTEAPRLARQAGAGRLWIKRDDVSGTPYGGNKVRKLEFLLGEALAAGATDVITFGAAGSNHALATAVYGSRHGLHVHSLLMSQPNARYVGRNLLAAAACGADLRHYADASGSVRAAARLRASLRERTGREPAVIPFGGTTPRSTAGFVNAGLELAAQVAEGVLPEPDLVYVALGSRGTAAGIALGLRAAGLRTRVVGVPIVSEEMGRVEDLIELIESTQSALHASDGSFPLFDWTPDDVRVAPGFIGERYARFTDEGMRAVSLALELEGVTLEGTYTGKALAALLADGDRGLLEGRSVVFWNTYNSRDLSLMTSGADASALPSRLRPYFDTPFQPLDVANGT